MAWDTTKQDTGIPIHFEGPKIPYSGGTICRIKSTQDIPTSCSSYYFDVELLKKSSNKILLGMESNNFPLFTKYSLQNVEAMENFSVENYEISWYQQLLFIIVQFAFSIITRYTLAYNSIWYNWRVFFMNITKQSI